MAGFGFDLPSEWPGIEVPSKVLPLYGFHPASWIGGPWMKRRGGLVAYLGRGRSHNVTLELKSKFPEQILGDVELRASVNGSQREVLKVSTGNRTTLVNLTLKSDDLVPMGKQGGYAVIDLESSSAYSEIGHAASGDDGRESSFQLTHWKIGKKPFKWWWR
jgi:hypothetical protein